MLSTFLPYIYKDNKLMFTGNFKNGLKDGYGIFYDNSGAFIVKDTQGVIPPKSNVRINITFHPYETEIYYERMFCLVRNHNLITLDVYGSCHDLLKKTAQLNQKMIVNFRQKMLKGSFFSKIKGLQTSQNFQELEAEKTDEKQLTKLNQK